MFNKIKRVNWDKVLGAVIVAVSSLITIDVIVELVRALS